MSNFDESLWPVLIQRVQGVVSDLQFEADLAWGKAYLQRGEKYVCIADMGRRSVPTVGQRQRQADWLKENEALMAERLLGCAVIITSPFLRMAMSTVLYLRPMPSPYVVVSNMAEALKWAADRLEDAGLLEAARRIRSQ